MTITSGVLRRVDSGFSPQIYPTMHHLKLCTANGDFLGNTSHHALCSGLPKSRKGIFLCWKMLGVIYFTLSTKVHAYTHLSVNLFQYMYNTTFHSTDFHFHWLYWFYSNPKLMIRKNPIKPTSCFYGWSPLPRYLHKDDPRDSFEFGRKAAKLRVSKPEGKTELNASKRQRKRDDLACEGAILWQFVLVPHPPTLFSHQSSSRLRVCRPLEKNQKKKEKEGWGWCTIVW